MVSYRGFFRSVYLSAVREKIDVFSCKYFVSQFSLDHHVNFFHVVNNLANYFSDDSVRRSRFRLLDKYFSLLDEFPDFRESEFDKPRGFFPDIFSLHESLDDVFVSNSEFYVLESEKRLKAKL